MSRDCLGRPTEDLIVEARLAVIKWTFPAHRCHLCAFRSTASMSHLTTWAAAGHERFTSRLKLTQFRASLLLLKKQNLFRPFCDHQKKRIISPKNSAHWFGRARERSALSLFVFTWPRPITNSKKKLEVLIQPDAATACEHQMPHCSKKMGAIGKNATTDRFAFVNQLQATSPRRAFDEHINPAKHCW